MLYSYFYECLDVGLQNTFMPFFSFDVVSHSNFFIEFIFRLLLKITGINC
jgi:hypothetical protein